MAAAAAQQGGPAAPLDATAKTDDGGAGEKMHVGRGDTDSPRP